MHSGRLAEGALPGLWGRVSGSRDGAGCVCQQVAASGPRHPLATVLAPPTALVGVVLTLPLQPQALPFPWGAEAHTGLAYPPGSCCAVMYGPHIPELFLALCFVSLHRPWEASLPCSKRGRRVITSPLLTRRAGPREDADGALSELRPPGEPGARSF